MTIRKLLFTSRRLLLLLAEGPFIWGMQPVYFMQRSAILIKLQPHESDNTDKRIVAISCKRVHGATRARSVKRVFHSLISYIAI